MNHKKNDKLPNILCLSSLACFIFAFIAGITTILASDYLSEVVGDSWFSLLGVMLSMAVGVFSIGIILMLVVRGCFPNQVFGKVLMWIYIIAVAMVVILIIVLIMLGGLLILGYMSGLAGVNNVGFVW